MRKLAVVAMLATCAGCSLDQSGREATERGPLGEQLGVDERVSLSGLGGPVDAVRDQDGRMHIYATTAGDAMRVEGYLVARDRHVQLELVRRLAEGRLGAILGHLDPTLVETDIAFRHLGLRRVAEQQYAASSAELRALLDAYADGVSQWFRLVRSGAVALPKGVGGFDLAALEDWTGIDSLAVGRLQAWLLSYDADLDLGQQALVDALRDTFRADAADALLRARAGAERDLMRFAPPDQTATIAGLAAVGAGQSAGLAAPLPFDADGSDRAGGARATTRPVVDRAPLDPRLLRAAAPYRRALARARGWLAPAGGPGSNNWAIAPSRSATGHSLLGSDPHLGLSSPAVFWPVSIHVEATPGVASADDLHVGGIAFPGIPGIILGHNRHVAWGATVAGYDVADVYRETLSAAGDAVLFAGDEVPLETITEIIEVRAHDPVSYAVRIVPHHGPIVPTIVDGKPVDPDPAVGALSVRWTGFEPTSELGAIVALLRARDVDEARAAFDGYATGAQNWMLADSSGNIAWTTHARVPIRDPRALAFDRATYAGLLPCLVLPGDGTAEWLGDWDDEAVPWARNPPSGYLSTANNDPVGGTFDNDPSDDSQPDGESGFLACSFDVGFRQGRIHRLIEEHGDPLAPADLAAIQADHRSALGARLAPALLLAIDNSLAEDAHAGSHPALAAIVADPAFDATTIGAVRQSLAAWGSEHDYLAAAGVDLDSGAPLALDQAEARAAQATVLFNAWLVRLLARTFGDELGRVGEPADAHFEVRALLHLTSVDPATLATFDPVTKDSALWDDLDTPEVESRQERMMRALLDALAWLAESVPGGLDAARWGAVHTVTFAPDVPLFGALRIPPLDDPVFAGGFPRPGDSFVIDASNFPLRQAAGEGLRFAYASGPTQRFVVDLDPAGPKADNALPGGAVWDAADPHFADQAELWRRNQTHPVPFAIDEVVAAAERRTVFQSPP